MSEKTNLLKLHLELNSLQSFLLVMVFHHHHPLNSCFSVGAENTCLGNANLACIINTIIRERNVNKSRCLLPGESI